MDEKKWDVVEIEIDDDTKRQLEELIAPMGLTIERLVQLFFEWLVNPETTEEAVAWLKNAIAEDDRA